MTPKQTAILNTMIVIGSGLLTGFAVSMALQYLTLTQIGIGACVVMLIFGIKMVYEIELSKAEYRATLNKMK